MSKLVGPLTDSIINNLIVEFKKQEHKNKIMDNIVNPLLCEVTSKYYSYFLIIIVAILMIILLLLFIIILQIKSMYNVNK